MSNLAIVECWSQGLWLVLHTIDGTHLVSHEAKYQSQRTKNNKKSSSFY